MLLATIAFITSVAPIKKSGWTLNLFPTPNLVTACMNRLINGIYLIDYDQCSNQRKTISHFLYDGNIILYLLKTTGNVWFFFGFSVFRGYKMMFLSQWKGLRGLRLSGLHMRTLADVLALNRLKRMYFHYDYQ